jgi:hypothetical protein
MAQLSFTPRTHLKNHSLAHHSFAKKQRPLLHKIPLKIPPSFYLLPSASRTITGSSVVIPSTPSFAKRSTSAGLFTVHT